MPDRGSDHSFTLPAAGDVTIATFNLKGEMIEMLLEEALPRGSHQVALSADSLPSGVYVLRIASGTDRIKKKVHQIK